MSLGQGPGYSTEKDSADEPETGNDIRLIQPRTGELASDDYDCVLCLRLLCAPVTLRCGHSFCGHCCSNLFKAKHAKCPTCRRVLPLHGQSGVPQPSVTLARLLESVFPEEYAKRKAEVYAEMGEVMHAVQGTSDSLPIFYLDSMLPRQRMQLNIFEPRYVTMVARALEGSRHFGMVGVTYQGRGQVTMLQHGVEVEIVENEEQGGRLHIEVAARRRFEICGDPWQQDDYAVADVRWMPWSNQEVGGGESEVVQAASALPALVEEWQSLVLSGGHQRFHGQVRHGYTPERALADTHAALLAQARTHSFFSHSHKCSVLCKALSNAHIRVEGVLIVLKLTRIYKHTPTCSWAGVLRTLGPCRQLQTPVLLLSSPSGLVL